MPSRFPFTSYPRGWFRVAAADELRPGDVRALHYFGRDLVIFRGRDGKAHLLDAHCPHLGTHLGIGGTVVGDTIECPFHGWRINGDGACVHIPYTDKIPPNAVVRTWPLEEVNGLLMTYYDRSGRPPDWHIPEFPEYRSDEWTPFHKAASWKIRTHMQELGENGMDNAHFPFLHPQQTRAMRTEAIEAGDNTFVHRTFQHYNIFGPAKLFVDQVTGPLDVCLYGLGCIVNRTVVDARIKLSYSFAFFFTPIDEEHIDVHSMVAMNKLPGRLMNYFLLGKAIKEGKRTIDQDVPIWENRKYRESPVLCEGDGPIMQFRRWASRYYDDGAEAGARR